MQPKPLRLNRAQAGLVVVDIQERLWPAMFEKDRLLQNAVLLIQGCAALGLPILATEQYPRGLGRSVPAVAAALAQVAPMEKTAFSACGAPDFVAALEAKHISQVLLCGIEAHVCVSQTALDLLEKGLGVFVVADAVSSRTAENLRHGLNRMRNAGAVIVSTEMALFELLGKAGTEDFKKILALVK